MISKSTLIGFIHYIFITYPSGFLRKRRESLGKVASYLVLLFISALLASGVMGIISFLDPSIVRVLTSSEIMFFRCSFYLSIGVLVALLLDHLWDSYIKYKERIANEI